MKMMISLLMIFLSINMIFLKNPISMGMIILVQTLLTCLISGMIINSYWFSYILFLIFIGGLLVLFIYVSSIASNELFKFKMINKFLLTLTFMFILMMSIYTMNNLNWMNLAINSTEMNNFFNYFMFMNNEYNINLTKLYNKQTYFLMFMMIIYLFITLIAMVKITNIFHGPLRMINS